MAEGAAASASTVRPWVLWRRALPLLCVAPLRSAHGTANASLNPKWLVSASSCRGVQAEYGLCSLPACQPCDPAHCLLSPWGDWSAGDCSGLCQRERGVEVENNACGTPCRGPVVETKTGPECLSCDAAQDCQWGSWLEWDDCTASCDSGYRTRLRRIAQAPVGGGLACAPLSRSEVEPCNMQFCGAVMANCATTQWQLWSDWSPCTADCDGGVSWRARSYAKDEAQWCPLPTGRSQEMKACNEETCVGDVDCQFSDWDPWSGCSCSCDGIMRRARRVSIFGRGKGRFCEAATKEIDACNPVAGAHIPDGCDVYHHQLPVDCQLGAWTPWSLCSATCGGGQRLRNRTVAVEPQHRGSPCSGSLEDLGSCNTQECAGVKMLSACEWAAWSEWSGCDHIRGQCGSGVKTRSRRLVKDRHVSGERCGQPSEEIASCQGECLHHCAWGEWGAYSECSATCGEAVRKRERELKLSIVPIDEFFDATYEALDQRAETVEHRRIQVVAVAFGCGFLGVVFAFRVSKACQFSFRS